MMITFEEKKKRKNMKPVYQKINTPVATMHDIYSSYKHR